MRIEFFPAAVEELIDAADYYETRLQGLGGEFLFEVERIAAVVLELPSLGERLDSVHRRVSLRRFPYSLVFLHDGDVIRVIAVAHRRRRPGYWSNRVQDR